VDFKYGICGVGGVLKKLMEVCKLVQVVFFDFLGGLGLHNLLLFNRALMGKQYFCILLLTF
jgi:hypothetical protein